MTQRALCSPRDIIDVAEGVNDHGHSVCTLVADIAELVSYHLPHVFGMCEQMQEENENVDPQVDQNDDQDAHL